MNFKNKTIFKIKGLNQERSFNNISKTVSIYNIKKEDDGTSQFEVDYKDAKKTKKFLEQQGFQILSVTNHGILFKFKNLFTRYGIVAGLIFCLLFYLLQYNFILQVKVLGEPSEIQSLIKEYVVDNLNSNFKYNIDTKEIENSIKAEFDQVSSVSVAIYGQTLLINYNPSTIPEEMRGEFDPIVSEYDGMITDIELVSGTINVKVGDIVQKGDVLVYPYIIDTDGETRQVTPSAKITANVWFSESITHYDYRLETKRTGKKIVSSFVKLGDLVIYSHDKENNFQEYEVESYSQPLTKNLLLPFTLEKIVYYQTQTDEIIEPFEEVREEVIEKAREKTLIFLDNNAIIINENYIIKDAGSVHNVIYTITTSITFGG